MAPKVDVLDLRAKQVDIETHVGDDIRFGATVKLAGVNVPAVDYSVETFIFDSSGADVSATCNFANEKFDGLVKFSLGDDKTIAMGRGRWKYAIVITLLDYDDYDRSVINGNLILSLRSATA